MGAFCLIIGGILGVVVMSLLSSTDDKTPSVESTKADVVYTKDIENEVQQMIDRRRINSNDYELGAITALVTVMEKIKDNSKEVYIVTNVG